MGCYNGQISVKGKSSSAGYSMSLLDSSCSSDLHNDGEISSAVAPGVCGTVYEQRNDLIAIRNQLTVTKDDETVFQFV